MADKRFSILVDDLSYCIVCGKPYPHKHEVFFGEKQRKHSIKYGMVLPLCYEHHEGDQSPHRDRAIDLQYKEKAQEIWENTYGNREQFIKIFGRSYL